jgi:hypothetical protein
MSQKWNLQDIRPAQPRKRRQPEEVSSIKDVKTQPRLVTPEPEDISIKVVDGKKKNRHTLIFAFVIFFTLVGGSFLISFLMNGAELTLTPRSREPNVNATIVAYKTPQAGELTYEIMSLEATGERQVSATGEETVVEKASGSVLIYNQHSTEPLRLITNTRFESPNGLIYRLNESIVVPGYTRDDANQIAPGVIQANVYADEVGEQYNIGPSRFTVPGFAGSPEFDNVYAESIAQMQGGFNGSRFLIDEAELQTAQQGLRLELRNSLLERIEAEKPAGFVYFPGAIAFTYEALPAVEYGENLATIKEKATLRIPLFKQDDFASYIAKSTIPGYEQVPVRIQDTSTLEFAYTSATTSASDISMFDSLEFTLIGRPLIIWVYDSEALLKDLAGKNKTALPAVTGGYPAIEKSRVEIRPFWKNTFPDEPSKTTIIEVLTE